MQLWASRPLLSSVFSPVGRLERRYFVNIQLNFLFSTRHRVSIVFFVSLLVIFNGCSEYERWRNDPPKIHTFTVPKEVHYGETVELRVNVSDPEDDSLTYAWDVSDGHLDAEVGSEVRWTAPELPSAEIAPPQTVSVYVSVSDGVGEETVSESTVIVVFSKAYRVAKSLSGKYALIRSQVSGESYEETGTMRLTITTFTREFQQANEFDFGTYQLIEPFDTEKGTIFWYSDGAGNSTSTTYTWDGALLVLFWDATATGHVYQKRN